MTPKFFYSGYGQKYGEMTVEMTNHVKDVFLPVLYVEVLPWYVRPYLHTMKVEVKHMDRRVPIPSGIE